jgi:hypothetical protein
VVTRHCHGIPSLLALLSANCPERQAGVASIYDLCGIHCPGLPALFLPPGTEKFGA